MDALLAGGDCPARFRRRMTVARMQEAMGCIQRLREIMGEEHFMYKTMTDALDARMNSRIALAFRSEGAMDAYLCEALLCCIEQGDHVDRDDVRSHISNARAASAVLERLDELGVK